MASPDPHLLAALADLEITVTRLGHTTERLEGEVARNRQLQEQVERLERHLDRAEERQRELHVLLLHRDREIASLWEQLRAGLATTPVLAPVPDVAAAPPPSASGGPGAPAASAAPIAVPSPAPGPSLLAAPPIESLVAFALVRAWGGLSSMVRRPRRGEGQDERGERG